MRNLALLLYCLALTLTASCGSGGSPVHTGSQSAAPQRYIVGLHAGASTTQRNAVAAQVASVPDQVYDRALVGFAGAFSSAEVARLKADPRVSFVEPDLPVQAAAQSTGWGVTRIDAPLNIGTGGSGVTVAVFDTGIDLTHPDLAGAIVANYNATGRGAASDGNGHGTHVAGIIGARNNTIGYVGVAPQCSLAAVKVLDNSGNGYISWIVSGINWAIANRTAHNIKVGNMSLTAAGSSSALSTAITSATNAGIVMVVAAGNNGANAAGYIPASYPNVICVSALNSNNTFASYSNWGSVVDLIAPGTNVPSLWKKGAYKTISGTSMASPHVAGSVALWFDSNSGGFADVLAALQSSGEYGTWAGDPDGSCRFAAARRDASTKIGACQSALPLLPLTPQQPASSATASASCPSPPTRTTACRRRAPSPTSRSAG
jgi:subtilisin